MERAPASVNPPERPEIEPSLLYLIKVGEIALKGENRSFFEAKLRHNIRLQLAGIRCTVSGGNGRFYLRINPDDEEQVRGRLAKVFGITSFSRTLQTAKEMAAIRDGALQLTAALEPVALKGSFKIEARRTDKSFPLRSYDIASELGSELQSNYPSLRVDVHTPDWVLNVEIRERAYLYIDRAEGPGGLPVGTSGRGLLLLSGGIDSPVAGYLMAKRGMRLNAVYFHAYPFTSDEARRKVESLARILAPYLSGLKLFVVPFTECQMRIKERAREEEVTLLMRASMMRIAETIAGREEAGCLVTGESLGQVASQTMESLRFTGSVSRLPVFRPLIGMDKEEIIALACKIGSFETSILPYEDCCTIFSPRHPLIRPKYQRMKASFESLDIDSLLTRSATDAELLRLSP